MSILSFLFNRKRKSSSLDMLPDAIMIFSKDFKLLEYNEYANSLLKITEKSALELMPENIFDCDFSILYDELLKKNNICTLKIKNSDIYVEIKASLMKNDKICFSMRDVTQKYKTVSAFMAEYETSKKINRTKNNLLIKLSNELTAPLHSISGFSQAMLEGLSGEINDKQKKYLNVINKNAFELLDLIDKLIEGARLEANDYEFNFKFFDIIDQMNNIISEFKQASPNIKMSSDFSKLYKRTVYCDETVLKKIIQYLLCNITKTNDYGELKINLITPDLDVVKQFGFTVDENSEIKNFLHIEILSNIDFIKQTNDLNMFEIYPQLEINAKREVLNNIPLYNASILSKYLKIKLFAKNDTKAGFDIIFYTEKL